MALFSDPTSAESGSFSILEDTEHQPIHLHHHQFTTQDSAVFNELPVENCQNKGRNNKRLSDISQICDQLSKLNVEDSTEQKSIKSTVIPQAHRFQRPSISQQTFEPLDSVLEEPNNTQAQVPNTVDSNFEGSPPSHVLAAATVSPSLEVEVKKHLSGQFEWLVSNLPAVAINMDQNVPPTVRGDGHDAPLAYGCNVLLRKQQKPGLCSLDEEDNNTNSFILLATPLPKESLSAEQLETLQDSDHCATMSWSRAPPSYQESTLRVPDVVEIVEHAMSPALSVTSEHSGSVIMASSPAGSCSLPRIEDSLEELDKLEEELEAIDAVTQFKKQTGLPANTPKKATPKSPSTTELSAAKLKRISMATMSSTVRSMSVEKASPSLRRSSSLTMHSRASKSPLQDSGNKMNSTPTRSPRVSAGPSTAPKMQCSKGAKAPTVPKFELPGEAVSRRLKEQREARQAQQELTKAAAVTPARPRTLTKPAFELPGEAISRRKREDREAKLKAQEEEDKKRREFKARPIRNGNGAQTMPRETIASRARQAKLQQDTAALTATSAFRSTKPHVTTPNSANKAVESKSLQVRKRTSVSSVNGSVVSTTSAAAVRANTISAGASQNKTLRRRSAMLEGLKDPKWREKQEKEEAMKVARKEAAERSRQASREWAEKQKRKGLALAEK